MNSDKHSSVDEHTGSITWRGDLSIEKGNHSHMPARTDVYLPGDERGHINASSLGGANSPDNVVAQNYDVNHGAYYSMEEGERSTLKNGGMISSEKTAVVDAQPGGRPDVFMVSDHVTYSDGHTESVHHSFTNASYAEQQAWNDQSAALPDTFDAPNPGNVLADSMTGAEYAELMEDTDACLPGIAEDYEAASAGSTVDAAGSTVDSTDSDSSCDADDN